MGTATGRYCGALFVWFGLLPLDYEETQSTGFHKLGEGSEEIITQPARYSLSTFMINSLVWCGSKQTDYNIRENDTKRSTAHTPSVGDVIVCCLYC